MEPAKHQIKHCQKNDKLVYKQLPKNERKGNT